MEIRSRSKKKKKIIKEVLAGLLSSPQFLKLCLLSLVSSSVLLSVIKLSVRAGSSQYPFFYGNRKPMAILREIYSLSLKKMEDVTLHKLI